jgi:hypothetical protein
MGHYNICNAFCQGKDGDTNNLIKHLRLKHSNDVKPNSTVNASVKSIVNRYRIVSKVFVWYRAVSSLTVSNPKLDILALKTLALYGEVVFINV